MTHFLESITVSFEERVRDGADGWMADFQFLKVFHSELQPVVLLLLKENPSLSFHPSHNNFHPHFSISLIP